MPLQFAPSVVLLDIVTRPTPRVLQHSFLLLICFQQFKECGRTIVNVARVLQIVHVALETCEKGIRYADRFRNLYAGNYGLHNIKSRHTTS